MKSLQIVWQRLVDVRGRTCNRCGTTQEGLQQAVETLNEVLRPLGIETTLEIRDIDEVSFKADPSESNRVWIAGKPIEEWLGARVASSPCCSVCGDAACRTIELGRDVFEAVPSEVIVKAALIAASQMVGPNTQGSSNERTPECCSD